MRTFAFHFLFLALCTAAPAQLSPAAPAAGVSARQKAETNEVLFIGNSYTYANRMPEMVNAMLRTKMKETRVGMLAKGAYSLDRHWADEGDTSARHVIESEPWDAVVLQDQSGRPALDPDGTITDVVRFENIIHARGARTVLFMTWGRGGDQFKESSKQIALGYSRAAVKSGAEIAPVGLAWFRAMLKDANLVLHTPDLSHPNVKGSYLSACVIYAALTGLSPRGMPGTLKQIDGNIICRLDGGDARWLQEVANDTVCSFQGPDAAKGLIASHEKTLHKWETFAGKLHKGLIPEAAKTTFGKPDAASDNDGKVIQTYRLTGEKELWLIYGKDRKLESASFQPFEGGIDLPEAPSINGKFALPAAGGAASH